MSDHEHDATPKQLGIRPRGYLVCLLAAGVVAVALSVTGAAMPRTGTTGAAAAPSFTGIAAGASHTCALTTGGGITCWGDGEDGRLGHAPAGLGVPVDVVKLTGGVRAIAAGSTHTCAITLRENVKCWGANGSGQLGRPATSTILTPVGGIGLASSSIAAGDRHTCAVTPYALVAVQCWGDNGDGQLGNGSTTGSTTPVAVVGLTAEITAITAGSGHTCALTSGGGVRCWGANGDGQLGNGSTTGSTTAVNVAGLTSGVRAIAAGGSHTCALTSGGGVRCWGANGDGQLGNGSTTGTTTLVNVAGLTSGVRAIAAGGNHTCALTSAGGARCWGANGDGQLGNGSTTGSTTPVDVAGLTSGVKAISSGGTHTCALTSVGGVKCWGSNVSGQLGQRSGIDSAKPLSVLFPVVPGAKGPARPCSVLTRAEVATALGIAPAKVRQLVERVGTSWSCSYGEDPSGNSPEMPTIHISYSDSTHHEGQFRKDLKAFLNAPAIANQPGIGQGAFLLKAIANSPLLTRLMVFAGGHHRLGLYAHGIQPAQARAMLIAVARKAVTRLPA